MSDTREYFKQVDDTERLSHLFGERVRQLRVARRLTQFQLGARALISGKFIGLVERGSNPSLANIFAIARGLSVQPEVLFTDVPVDASDRALTKGELAKVAGAIETLNTIFPGKRHR